MFLKDRADDYIPKRVDKLARKYGFNYNKVKIKNLSSSWGSCTSNKNLSFNLKLMCFNQKVIDYVIIHELCHLRIMSHSKRFWKLVENIIPDYKDRKLELDK
jgi:predicted metal-dependent hydrolase